MGRGLDSVIASFPQRPRDRIDARYTEEIQEVEGLRALRRIAGKAQADVAAALKIKQPSVSKIENQVDMYVSTLRSYVEAVGGKLELTVRLPKQPTVRIHALGEIAATISENLAPPKTSLAKAGHRG
ncbi:XRE family transcriptional regulator [Mesorhizobium newzealandense]|uniref:XRE family transcriptional regulator n=3 Tax=Mesorhizobium TaxID=68287 RepID=A0ABW4W9E2_9HYPH|nr:XRE family transcriptional regulator [Mesorhizobium sophorae]